MRKAAALLALVAFAGCATSEVDFHRSLGPISKAVSSTWRALDRYDKEKMDAMTERFKSDPVGAIDEYRVYAPQRDSARKALVVITDGLDFTNEGSQLYTAYKAKDWGRCLQILLQMALTLRDAVKGFGIEVPL